jgi:hypothetical protein
MGTDDGLDANPHDMFEIASGSFCAALAANAAACAALALASAALRASACLASAS